MSSAERTEAEQRWRRKQNHETSSLIREKYEEVYGCQEKISAMGEGGGGDDVGERRNAGTRFVSKVRRES